MLRSNPEEKKPTPKPLTLSQAARHLSEGNTYGSNWQVPVENLDYKSTESVYYTNPETTEEYKTTSTASCAVCTTTDSQNTAFTHTQQEIKSEAGPLVMNAANAWHIGGAFERNGGTQEESLFFTTNLHKYLYEEGHPTRHPWNPVWTVQHYDKPLQHTLDPAKGPNALYTQNVYCFKKAANAKATLIHQYEECAPFSFAVFTVAGFDLRTFGDNGNDRHLFESADGFQWDTFTQAMQMKYELFFETALKNQHKSVVAAALGCGAFAHTGYSPRHTYEAVATAYANAVKKYANYFQKIDIVVLDPTAAAIFQKKIDSIEYTPQELPPAYLTLVEQQPFFQNDIAKVEKTYKRLLGFTNEYLQESCFNATGNPTLLAVKRTLFTEVQGLLQTSITGILTLQEKHTALQRVTTYLSELATHQDFTSHRTDWRIRYLYNALSIITVLPAVARICSSRYYYGSFQFWKPNSLKVFETMQELVGIPANKPAQKGKKNNL